MLQNNVALKKKGNLRQRGGFIKVSSFFDKQVPRPRQYPAYPLSAAVGTNKQYKLHSAHSMHNADQQM